MIGKILNAILGNRNQRVLKKLNKKVERINQLESDMQSLSDSALREKTSELKARYAKGESLEDLLPEAFALVRLASQRTLGLRHYDVQLIGGMVLHQGKISEMQTGEGKTLVATLPAFLNALTGNSVHIITVNDYLAERDAAWMGPIYEFLGLSVGVIVANLEPQARKGAYAADIVYGTNNEFGFDYLRDNMAFSLEDKVQRDLSFAIVDEVDSILIDEARTPLVISGQAEDSSALYRHINLLIPKLKEQTIEPEEGVKLTPEQIGDYTVDEKSRQVYLTEDGSQKVEELLVRERLLEREDSLYSSSNVSLMHHVNAALRAHALFKKDIDYIVRDDQIIIIDEHTGRMMPGRRWSEGIHQAVEAKEGVRIQNESQTLASITFQNYFRLYNKLSGMTGTADTEAYEFQTIYGLEVVAIPPNRPNRRDDGSDLVYMSAQEKFNAIIDDIKSCREANRPVLVGTTSIETSELISRVLSKHKIEHQVLNAKQHAKEAQIIAQAGVPGAVTIATNMAGRGTDIVLGGSLDAMLANNPDADAVTIEKIKAEWQLQHQRVIDAGGLHIVGTERHESRRIDNQLRGRSGRQGDPGSSRFYLSLEDNLIRIFASERMTAWMQRIGLEEGEAIEHPWLSRAIENAQRKVEGRNFDIRKQLLEFDDVANDQRKTIYSQRAELMAEEDISHTISNVRKNVFGNVIAMHVPPQSIEEQWDIPGLEEQLLSEFNVDLPVKKWLEEDEELYEETLRKRVIEGATKLYENKEKQVEPQIMRHFEKAVMLQVLDRLWREHLADMDYLRQGIGLRSFAQKQPMQEYKREAFQLFSGMLESLQYEVISILSKVEVRAEEDVEAIEAERRNSSQFKMNYRHDQAASGLNDDGQALPEAEGEKPETYVRQEKKVGRNEPCPCGSGKKYKQCHGKIAERA